jgi:hypothetical protein
MNMHSESIILEINELMVLDDYDTSKKEEALNLIKKVLNIKTYFESVKNDFDKILEDKKIDSKDISKMMIVMIKLNNLLPKLLNLKEKISIDKMKYIFYATIYFYIIQYQPEFFNELQLDEFRLLYSNLWNLVEINPETVKVAAKKFSGFGCCGKSDIREQNEPTK